MPRPNRKRNEPQDGFTSRLIYETFKELEEFPLLFGKIHMGSWPPDPSYYDMS